MADDDPRVGIDDTLPADAGAASVARANEREDERERAKEEERDSTRSLTAPDIAPLINNRYEVLGWIGAGGMGNVYKVRDRELDEVIALKVVRREIATSPDAIARFRREAKLARRVTHRNVARTFDVGEHAGDRFLTMEYIDGSSLGDRLEREGRLDPADAVKIAQETCEGLAAAHVAEVVHRDLKPDNILIERKLPGRVVLTDFGIAVAVADAGKRTMGRMVGTVAYMAPEQVEGGVVDARADLYALGGVIYEMLTGVRAWPGEEPIVVAAARLLRPPPDPRTLRPDLSEELAALVMRLMARKPDERFASAMDALAALAHLSQRASSALRPSSPPNANDTNLEPRHYKSVAVLPFKSGAGAAGGTTSGTTDEDAILADGVTDDLIDALSTESGIRVSARAVVEEVAARHRDPREIGRDLGVQVIVCGSIRRFGEAVRLSARVIGVEDGIQLWATRVDRPIRELLIATDELGRAAATALLADLRARPRVSVDPRAIELYFRARFEMRGQWLPDMERAQPLIEEALRIAPNEPSILSAYATMMLRRAFLERSADALVVQAREAAQRALRSAPDMGEPLLALARIHVFESQPTLAVHCVRRALRSTPGLGPAHELLGLMLLETGPFERAVHHLDTAVTLEPTWIEHRFPRARAHALLGQWDDVARMLSMKSEQHSLMRLFHLLRYALWRGIAPPPEEYGTTLPPAITDSRPATFESGPSTFIGFYSRIFKHGHLLREDADYASEWAIKTPPNTRQRMFFNQLTAEIFAYASEADKALAAIEASVDSGLVDVVWLDHCPLLNAIRTDKRFIAQRSHAAARARAVSSALDEPLRE